MGISRTRTTLFVAAVTALGIGVPTAIVGRELHQESLDQDLISAVDRDDATSVRLLLRGGADANATIMPHQSFGLWARITNAFGRRSHDARLNYPSILLYAAEQEPADKGESYWLALDQGRTPEATDNVAVVSALLGGDADVNYRGVENVTPLLAAARRNKFDTVVALLRYNPDVNAAASDGQVAMECIAFADKPALVELLFQHGSHLNATSTNRPDPLNAALYAAMQPRKITDVRATVACLLRHGAKVDESQPNRLTVLHLASAFRDQRHMEMLKQAGAK